MKKGGLLVITLGVLVLMGCQTTIRSGSLRAMDAVENMAFAPLEPGQYEITGPYSATAKVVTKAGIIDESSNTQQYGFIGNGRTISIATLSESEKVELIPGVLSVGGKSTGDPETIALMNALYEVIGKANTDGADYLFLPRVQKKISTSGTTMTYEVTVFAKGLRITGQKQ